MYLWNSSSALRWWISALVVVFPFVALVVRASRSEDGQLSLLVALPLTENNASLSVDPGFFHLAAALLAVEHFNERNSSLVPALGKKGCNATFSSVRVVDTGTTGHRALQSLLNDILGGTTTHPPDAIAGPYHELPALELSVLATGLQIPMVTHRGSTSFDGTLLDPRRHPFFTQVGADFDGEMEFLAHYLLHSNRTDYVAVLHANSGSSLQKSDILQQVLEHKGFTQVRAFAYQSSSAAASSPGSYPYRRQSASPELEVNNVLARVQRTGFRTIVLLPTDAFLKDDDATEIGVAATQQGLDTGQHLWVVSSSGLEEHHREVTHFLESAHHANYLKGAAYLFPYDGYEPNNNTAKPRFRDHLLQQGPGFLSRVRDLLPPMEGYYYQEELDRIIGNDTTKPLRVLQQHFQSSLPGAGFLYDAIVSIGLGHCQATGPTTGIEHRDAIRALGFLGATGPIRFGGTNGHPPGSRVGSTVPFAVADFVANERNGLVWRQHGSWNPRTGQWLEVHPFVYADGTQNPPELRAPPAQNYISPAIRGVGMAMLGVSLLVVLASALWVYANRHNTVVLSSQPVFLYTLCFASAMASTVMLFAAFDESWGFDQQSLDQACYAGVWFDGIATTLIYSCLFTKLWRANRCLRYKTRNISLGRALWPGALILLAVVVILTAMTVHGDYGWVRKEVDEESGASVGLFTGHTVYYFLIAMHTVHLIPIVLSGFLAWKTKDFDEAFSESKFILALILVQSQVMLIGIPVIVLLDEISPNIRYMGIAFLAFSLPMSTMGLIILPKVLVVSRMRRKAEPTRLSAESFPATLGGNEEATSERIRDELAPTSSTPHSVARSPSRIQVVTFD